MPCPADTLTYLPSDHCCGAGWKNCIDLTKTSSPGGGQAVLTSRIRARASGLFAHTTVHGVVPPPLADSLPATATCSSPAVRAVPPRDAATLWAVLWIIYNRPCGGRSGGVAVGGGIFLAVLREPRGAARGTSCALQQPILASRIFPWEASLPPPTGGGPGGCAT